MSNGIMVEVDIVKDANLLDLIGCVVGHKSQLRS